MHKNKRIFNFPTLARRTLAVTSMLVVLAGSAVALVACGKTPPPTDHPRVDEVPTHAVAETGTGLRIHALRTGWVRVKRTHRELDVAGGLRFPVIIGQREWAGWMPIIVYAVERTDGSLILVDTGPAPDILEPEYFADDPRNQWFYRRNLDFAVADGDTLGERMAEVGLDPRKVSDVVISHFHADHVGGLELVPQARVLVGPGNWPKHTGSYTAQLGEDFAPTIASYEPRAIAGFAESLALTDDGRVAMVPLPGHTPGHAGVVVVDGERVFIIAGDATFDDDQTVRGGVSGATQKIAIARATQAQLAAALAAGAVLLPAHDPQAFAKLGL